MSNRVYQKCLGHIQKLAEESTSKGGNVARAGGVYLGAKSAGGGASIAHTLDLLDNRKGVEGFDANKLFNKTHFKNRPTIFPNTKIPGGYIAERNLNAIKNAKGPWSKLQKYVTKNVQGIDVDKAKGKGPIFAFAGDILEKRPEVVAHELGHHTIEAGRKAGKRTLLAKGMRGLQRHGRYGMMASTPLALGGAYADDPKTQAMFAAGSVAAGAPTFINEAHASKRGLDMLRKEKAFASRMPSFRRSLAKAMGTYGAATLAPGAILGGVAGYRALMARRQKALAGASKTASIKSSIMDKMNKARSALKSDVSVGANEGVTKALKKAAPYALGGMGAAGAVGGAVGGYAGNKAAGSAMQNKMAARRSTDRLVLKRAMDAFLAKGGRIKKLPIGAASGGVGSHPLRGERIPYREGMVGTGAIKMGSVTIPMDEGMLAFIQAVKGLNKRASSSESQTFSRLKTPTPVASINTLTGKGMKPVKAHEAPMSIKVPKPANMEPPPVTY